MFKLVLCNRKHRREVLWNVHYFRTLIGYTESYLGCNQIEFIRFLNKCCFLWLKYFSKVRFVCEVKLILPKYENIRKRCCFDNVVFIRWKRHTVRKRDVSNSSSIAFIFQNLNLFRPTLKYLEFKPVQKQSVWTDAYV